MVNTPKSRNRRRVPVRLEGDARSIVPVTDEIGGTVVYLGGTAAYYVLNGECFAPFPIPGVATTPVDRSTS